MAELALRGLTKSYDGRVDIVRDIDLTVADGEFMVFVGPSGCGKSTTLRMIAGLEDITAGELAIGGRVVNDVPASRRGVAMVFQSYALYPHMTVAENLGFALKLAGAGRDAIARAVAQAAEVLRLTDLLDRKPKALSGGQRQRVAIGRAIVRQPEVFLFDEPLSNLDAALRVQMRAELAQLHATLGTTMVYVTHDQVEAMTLGQRIAVFHDGRIEQCDSPQALYERPATLFVAGFIGSPQMNVLPVTWRAEAAQPVIESGGGSASGWRWPLPAPERFELPAPGTTLQLGFRPEHVQIVARGEGDLPAQVQRTEYLGSERIVHLTMPGDAALPPLRVRETQAERLLPPGAGFDLRLDPARIHLFDSAGRSVARASQAS